MTVGESASVTLTLQVGAAEDVTVRGTSAVNTQTGELSFLTDQRTIEHLPVNGRNYTDLMQLHPSVNLFPHRDNGSVVAHGLAMSVNGQNPRANTYLLDGTLQNDFTNSPAGSAAGTALGMETIREFRLASNSYSAEYGRAAGGQINVITKSGTNLFSGSAFTFHRNSGLDASNYFDGDEKPSFRRYQSAARWVARCGATGCSSSSATKACSRTSGRTIVTTVPDDNARQGILPDGPRCRSIRRCCHTCSSFRWPTARRSATASPSTDSGSISVCDRTSARAASTRCRPTARSCSSATRWTMPNQALPTDYPQFPRAFVSRNQFLTAEYRGALTPATFATARFGFSGTRIAQTVESNTTQPLSSFVPGQPTLGAIDIGGVPRFGPQLSADLVLEQDVYSGQVDVTHVRGRHLLKAGALVERYGASELNPTFSRGVYRFASLPAFLAGLRGLVHRPDAGGRREPQVGLDAGRRLRAGRLGGRPRRDDQRRVPRGSGDGAASIRAT